jgi:hypothetical protein
LLYRDNGGAAADDTAKGYMRRVAGGGITTSRWLSNEGCLPLREKAARAIHYSTLREKYFFVVISPNLILFSNFFLKSPSIH